MLKRFTIVGFLLISGQMVYSQLNYYFGKNQEPVENLYSFNNLRFDKIDGDYDSFFLFGRYIFYSSYSNKEIVVEDSNRFFQVERITTDGIHEIMYYPIFYSDGKNVFFKRSLISIIISFMNENEIWEKNELVKMGINYHWVYHFANKEILLFYSDGVPERQNKPNEFAAIYYKSYDSLEYKTLESITLDNFPSRLTTSRHYKPLYIVVCENNLVVFNNHNKKLVVYDEGLHIIKENNLDYDALRCKIREYSDKTPSMYMIAIKQDQKTGNLYFYVRDKQQKIAVFWEILFDEDFSITGYKEIDIINHQDFDFQQIYNDKIYYLVENKLGKFKCLQKIGD